MMKIAHRYSGIRTIGDMKRAIALAEAIGYTEDAMIDPIILMAPPRTFEFSQEAFGPKAFVPKPQGETP